ncbi:MAG TPA: ABC transporter substrate-binding protein [Steroidobacteraceae bacterium]|nr:ABC transporter substrate-binding protein [Steroidobacteraceae bacterium]
MRTRPRARTTLPPAQQQQLIAAFTHYVTATYADQFDTYSGEELQVAGERPYGADLMVQTKIIKSNGEATRLDYLIRQGRISDVYLDGTISQLAVHRSESHSILQREGIEGLVAALKRKTDLLKSVARASSYPLGNRGLPAGLPRNKASWPCAVGLRPMD